MFQKMNDNKVIMAYKHSYIWSTISESGLAYSVMDPTVLEPARCMCSTPAQVFGAQHLLFVKQYNNMDTWLETFTANMSTHNYNPC